MTWTTTRTLPAVTIRPFGETDYDRYVEIANPNYRPTYGDAASNYNAELARIQAQLEQKAADLQRRMDTEPEKADDYRKELQTWWAQNTPHLTGIRAAAER